MAISKTYRFNKHIDEMGDVERLTMQLVAIENDSKCKLMATQILSEADSDNISNMTDAQLLSYTESQMQLMFTDEDIRANFNAASAP